MTQLGNGAGQLIKEFEAELRAIFDATDDLTIRNHVLNLRAMLLDDMRPKLQRAQSAEPTAEMRQRALEARVAQLEAWKRNAETILSVVEQTSAQHL